MTDEHNPYAPPKEDYNEPFPPPPPSAIIGKNGLKYAVPLLRFLVEQEKDENGRNLISPIFDARLPHEPNPYFYTTHTDNSDVQCESKIREYCTLETTEMHPYSNLHRILNFNLGHPDLKPAPFEYSAENPEIITIGFNADLMQGYCEDIRNILTKYCPEGSKELRGFIRKTMDIEKFLDVLVGTTHTPPDGLADEFYTGKELEDDLGGHDPKMRYYTNSGYNRMGNISAEDQAELSTAVEDLISTYENSKDLFNKATHHLLYKQAERGLGLDVGEKEVERGLALDPEVRPGLFKGASSSAFGAAKRFARSLVHGQEQPPMSNW